VDGVEYANVSNATNYGQRYIHIVNDWQDGERIVVQNEIKIVFAQDEIGTKLADGFKGIYISG
jgi:hypothetical protein